LSRKQPEPVGVSAQTGKDGESAAVRFLEDAGYRVLLRNWSCPIGEVDIVCLDGDTHVLVEVKSSRTLGMLPPESRVGAKKRRKLTALAHYYVKHRRVQAPVRFDVISVWWENDLAQVRHLRDAFHAR